MKDIMLHFWWVGALFSAVYTAGSVWWTYTAERRFRALKREQNVQAIAYCKLHATVENIQSFLENGNTLRQIKTPSVVLPLVVPRANREICGCPFDTHVPQCSNFGKKGA